MCSLFKRLFILSLDTFAQASHRRAIQSSRKFKPAPTVAEKYIGTPAEFQQAVIARRNLKIWPVNITCASYVNNFTLRPLPSKPADTPAIDLDDAADDEEGKTDRASKSTSAKELELEEQSAKARSMVFTEYQIADYNSGNRITATSTLKSPSTKKIYK